MIDSVYQFLDRMGYTHPIHPPLTHMLIGLVVGAFIFGLAAILLRRPMMMQTARHCIILAYFFLFPMALLGYMDWQHYFGGAWLLPIKIKITLTFVFLVLITLGLILGNRFGKNYKSTLAVYGLCVMALTGLGYYGGHLAFGCRSITAPKEFEVGGHIFSTQCSSCHPQGGNIITPNIPLRGAKQMEDFNTFLTFMRKPVRPDGSKGIMPAFPPKKISDEELRELYEYLINVLERPVGQ